MNFGQMHSALEWGICVTLTLEGVLRFNLANISSNCELVISLDILDTNGQKSVSQIFYIPTSNVRIRIRIRILIQIQSFLGWIRILS